MTRAGRNRAGRGRPRPVRAPVAALQTIERYKESGLEATAAHYTYTEPS